MLNERVSVKAPAYVTPKSRQIDYPLYTVSFGKSNTLVPNTDRLDAYLGLTTEEKYVFLLETAWCYIDWTMLDGEGRSGQGAEWFRSGVDKLLTQPVGVPIMVTQEYKLRDKPNMICLFPTANVYLRAGYWLGWYGIHEVARPKRDRYALEIDQITLTDWGRDCLTTLRRKRPFHHWNKNAFSHFLSDTDEGYTDTIDTDINHFADAFRTLLNEPELLSLYPIKASPPTGAYWLRVELPHHGVSRTLALPAEYTLDDLHLQIQKAVNFDDDHLYQFFMNPRNPYNGEQYYDPRAVDGWTRGFPAADTTLAMLNLYEGQRFLYIFDFGDHWEFYLTVVRHLPDDTSGKARIVEKVGKLPKQYSGW